MKKFMIIGVLLLLASVYTPIVQSARGDNGVPYETYAEDSKRQLIQSPTAYIPIASYKNFQTFQLDGPEDIFIDQNNQLYIADTLNRRILIIEPNLESVRSIGQLYLQKPTGVYSDSQGQIFVADYQAQKVFIFEQDGSLIRQIDKPLSPTFGINTTFRPTKVRGDASGNLYVLSEGTFQGLVQFDKEGEFLGFFGANPVKPDLRIIALQAIFSKDVVANFIKVIPQTMSNVAIDHQSRIYTVTRGATGNAIKRLNISGINRLPSNMNDGLTMSAIAIGPIGNIFSIGDDGIIREFDSEGNLLFQFGGLDNRSYQNGLFTTASGIAVDAFHNLYIIDKAKDELQVFVPTEFASIVHTAVDLYQRGLYLESQGPWEAVLAQNALFDLAHKGIGHAYMKAGLYEEALESYRQAGYPEGYSQAYWEVRNHWLNLHLSTVMIILGVVYVAYVVLQKVTKKQSLILSNKLQDSIRNQPILRDIVYSTSMLKHPLNSFYEIKRERKVSLLGATILYVILFLESIFAIYYEGFPFNSNALDQVSFFNQAIQFLGPLFLFVLANYFVGSVNGGEGKLKDLYTGTIYSMSPLLLFWPILILLSRVLTLNESFIYQAAFTILIGWSGILGFFMIKDIHNYSIFETIKNIVITLFTIVMIIVSFILLSSLADQAFQFIIEIFTEVFIRV